MPRPSQQIDQSLIAAGRELFPAAGCAGLSVRALAAHAGVAPGMFHYHFGSKDRFLRSLFADIYDGMFASLAREVALPATPLERLRAVMRLFAHFARTHRRLLARLWLDAMSGHDAARDFFREHAPRHSGLMLQLIADAQARGELRELPPLQCLAFLMGTVPMPMIFAAGLVDDGLLVPGGARAFNSQVMSEAATDARIDLALSALSAAAPRSASGRAKRSAGR